MCNMMDGEIGCVLVNLLVKTIFTNIIYVFFLNDICYFFLNQTSMVIKATKTSQSKRFRRRASTTRSILRRRRISRRVRKCCRVRRKGTMGGARKERVGDRQQLGVELRPVRKCGAGGGRHRVGGDDTVTIGGTDYTVKELTEQKLVIQTNINGKDLVIKSTSGGNLKNIIQQAWSGKIQNGFVTDPLNHQSKVDTIIPVEADGKNTYAGKIQVVQGTFRFIAKSKRGDLTLEIQKNNTITSKASTRFVVLEDGELSYWKNNNTYDERKPEDTMYRKNRAKKDTMYLKSNTTLSEFRMDDKNTTPFHSFSVNDKETTWKFKAANDKEMKEWLDVLIRWLRWLRYLPLQTKP